MRDDGRPLVVVEGDASGMCDPETGFCAWPDATAESDDAVTERA